MSDIKKNEEKKEELTELIEEHLDAVSGGGLPHNSHNSTVIIAESEADKSETEN